jgi:hypothetical protein
MYSKDLKVRNHLRVLDVDGRVNTKVDLNKEGVDWVHVAQDRNQCSNEHWGGIKGGEFFDYLNG